MLKHLFRLALGAGISAAIIALLLRITTVGLSDSEQPGVWASLANLDYSLVVAFIVLALIGVCLRAWRFRVILQVNGSKHVPTYAQLWLVTGVRNMFVDLLPARLGELIYIGLLNRGYGVGLAPATSSLAVSFVLDLVAMVGVLLVVLTAQLIGGTSDPWVATGIGVMTVMSMVIVVVLFYAAPSFARWFEDRTAGLKANWVHRLSAFGLELADNLVHVRNAGAARFLFSISVVIRLLKYTGFYCLFMAVSKFNFPDLYALNLVDVSAALIGGEIGASLPIPSLMSFGAYEAGSSLVMHLLGVTNSAGVLVSFLCVHILSQCVEYVLGGALLILFFTRNGGATMRLNQDDLTTARINQKPSLGYALSASTIFIIGCSFLVFHIWAAGKLGAMAAPKTGAVVNTAAADQDLPFSVPNGFVVFSSNRDGNHDILRLELPSRQLTKLTNHPHTETYPRLSSDGQRMVFSRGHFPWVSQRNVVAWDVLMLDLSTGEETVLIKNATAPAWVDEHRVSVQHNTNRIVEIDTRNLSQRLIYESGKGNRLPNSAGLYNPKVNSKTGAVAFTSKQSAIGSNTGFWGTAIARADQLQAVLNGCELSWSHDGERLFQVNPDAASLRIMQIDPESLKATPLIDLSGEFSHEYWPKESWNGEYMVFGASRGKQDHEHDTKDYEIFLWKLGGDPSQAVRLTFHTGNDNWPDVHIRE